MRTYDQVTLIAMLVNRMRGLQRFYNNDDIHPWAIRRCDCQIRVRRRGGSPEQRVFELEGLTIRVIAVQRPGPGVCDPTDWKYVGGVWMLSRWVGLERYNGIVVIVYYICCGICPCIIDIWNWVGIWSVPVGQSRIPGYFLIEARGGDPNGIVSWCFVQLDEYWITASMRSCNCLESIN
jgi:hypothetical protein